MKINNNTPRAFQKYQDQALQSASIEDGNATQGTKQGKIYTSELTVDDQYSTDYVATLLNVAPAITSTGSLYNYTFVISYNAVLLGGATDPGFYGSNLLKENDAFTIVPQNSSVYHDWIRGFVNRVSSVTWTNAGSSYTFVYTIYCTITQGDPKMAYANDSSLVWKRQRFMDESTFDEAYIPTNLSGSFNKRNYDLYLYWNDINEDSLKYNVNFRSSLITNTSSIYHVSGTNANFNGSLQPIIDVNTGDISTIQITDPGSKTHSWRTIDITGTGSGSLWAANFNYEGGLSVEEYNVIGITPSVLAPAIVGNVMGYPGTQYQSTPGVYVAATDRFYVCSWNGQVAVVNPATNTIESLFNGCITNNAQPNAFKYIAPLNRFYELDATSTINVIDLASYSVIGVISTTNPAMDIEYDNSSNLWAVCYPGGTDDVYIIDAFSNTVVTTLNLANPASKILYVSTTNHMYIATNADIVIVDAYTFATVATIPITFGSYVTGLIYSSNTVYVTTDIDGITVINTTTYAYSNIAFGTNLTLLYYSAANGHIYLGDPGSIEIFDTATNSLLPSIAFVSSPTCADLNTSNGTQLYVSGSGGFKVIDITTDTVVYTNNTFFASSAFPDFITYIPSINAFYAQSPYNTDVVEYTNSSIINIKHESTKPYPWLGTYPAYNNGVPFPFEDSFIEGLPGLLYNKYRISSASSLVGAGEFVINIAYAEDSSTNPFIPSSWSSIIGSKVKVHNGVTRVNAGVPSTVYSGGSSTFNITAGSNKVYFDSSVAYRFLQFFLGSEIITPSATHFVGGTYITKIDEDYITLSNPALASGTSVLLYANGIGHDYLGKAKADVKKIPDNVRCYIDPVVATSLAGIDLNDLGSIELAVSVATIYSKDGKKYTDWTEEEYIKTYKNT